jgi:peptidoglycan/LPS O-acetylase OafA/YrhL
LVVCIGHSTYRGYTGHPFIFWFVFPYAQTAVVGFFVLSGFVIAHVSATKESAPQTYAVARISRLYSVIIPALVLTAILDGLGNRIDPALYTSGPAPLVGNQVANYLATFFLVHQFSWFAADMSPGTNGVFWSLGLEATYYVIFGLFLTRKWFFASIGSIILLWMAGFFTTALFPCWILGVVLYHLNARFTLGRWVALALFVVSAFAIVRIGWLRSSEEFALAHRYSLRYAEALFFACNILAVGKMSSLIEALLGRFETLIRWLGSLTFALYLCHRPLLQFFATVRLGVPGMPLQHLWLFGMSALVIIGIASLGEWLRRAMRRHLSSMFQKVRVAIA